jgi:type VI secretion system secreted protein Hcp
MALNAYLKIDGVLGESQDERHKGEIDVLSFSWGASQAGAVAHGSGGGAGKVSMQDFQFTMKVNKASPVLMRACASGEHLPRAVLTCRKAGGVPPATDVSVLSQSYEIAPIDRLPADGFLKFTLSDILVSSYEVRAGAEPHLSTDRQAGDGSVEPAPSDGSPMDAVSLNFAKIEFWYQAQAGDGSVLPAVQLGWDLKRNAAF